MSAPAKCPLCGTKLRPEMEGCPNCPMSFGDGPPEKTALQNDSFRNFGIPFLIFGGLAYCIWAFSQYMWRTAEEGTRTVSTSIKKVGVLPSSSAGAGVVPTDSQSIHALVLEQTTGVYDPKGVIAAEESRKRVTADEGPGTISIMPEKGPQPKIIDEWKVRGVIYDLVTLKPVPGVHMIFTDNVTNSRVQIKTDEEGRYKALLPFLAGRGYLVTLSKAGYEKSYLDPGTEGVSEMTVERRTEISKELASLIAEPASLQPNADTPLVTDFHLAPK